MHDRIARWRQFDMRVLSPRKRSGSLVRVALLLLSVAAAYSGAGSAAAASPQGAPAPAAEATSHFAIADFDGDSQPDLATVQVGETGGSETRYWIRFRLSTGSQEAIGVRAPAGGLEIASRDVNGDNFLDLVVTTAGLNRPVAVLLNDGNGNFTLNDPGAFPGLVWGSETSWAPTGVQSKDATALVASRYLSGDCEENKRIPSPAGLPGVLAHLHSRVRAFQLGFCVLGRAPPTAVPSV
jgi:FG-GAP-like repeat